LKGKIAERRNPVDTSPDDEDPAGWIGAKITEEFRPTPGKVFQTCHSQPHRR